MLTGQAEQGLRDTTGEQAAIARIKNNLPASEKVEWPGSSVETSNEWVARELDRFTASSDAAERATILTGLKERLAAISKEVDALQKSAASGTSKDKEKQKLGEILQRPEYQKASPPEESLFQKWMREFREWMESVFPDTPKVPSTVAGLGSLKLWLQVLVYALVVGLIVFILYKFLPFFRIRRGKRSIADHGDRVILGERIAGDESAFDIFAEAERLAREGDLRGAIRKGYIALLCELSDRKVIGLARHKTNRDYLRDLRKRRDLLPNVSGLTTSYERSWYGLRSSDESEWEDFRLKYRETVAQVK